MSSLPSTVVVPALPAAIALVLAAVLLGAVFGMSLPDDQLWQRVLENSGHGPAFAALAVVLIWLRSPPPQESMRSVAQYRNTFVLAGAIGVATELAQAYLPMRNVSLWDALHDAAGATLGLASFWSVERWLARRQGLAEPSGNPVLIASMAVVASLMLAWQPLQCARAYAGRANAWPTLAPLDKPATAAFVTVHLARMSMAPLPEKYRRSDDGESLRVEFNAGTRPGLHLLEPFPDWSGKDLLVIDLTNPSSQPFELVLRVLDRSHDWTHEDRFNQRLVIPAATRTAVRISLEAIASSPRARRMDMTAIADVMLFARRPFDAGEFYVTRLRLE